MPRQSRAKQFMPFDALKGLNEELRLKEFENEQMQKQELQPEQIAKINNLILNIKKDKIYNVKYFENGHIYKVCGKIKVNFVIYKITVESKESDFKNKEIDFENIVDILSC